MARPKRGEFHPRLAEHRRRLGLTQAQVAQRLEALALEHGESAPPITGETVARHERGRYFPSPVYRRQYVRLYSVAEEHLGLVLPAGPLIGEVVTARTAAAHTADGLESPLDIAERIQGLAATNTSDTALDQIDAVIGLIIEEYETAGPASLAPRVVRQRRQLDPLFAGVQLPRQRERLFRTAGRLSAMLGYMAVNLGKFSTAKAYCEEAFYLAELVDDADLQAWTRGTESFCAYYQGNYRAAADLARDGQRYAKGGPQAVRLAINGEARALGKLRDFQGVNEAVDRAYRLADEFDAEPGVSPCISFGVYSPARTASNAATAYVSLGAPERVAEYADLVMPVFEASESRWSQSLVRLDIARAMIAADRPEPEQAAGLVTEALMLSADRPITSVLSRSREFLTASARWSELPEVIEAAETLRIAERR
jgi:tetratricopeptide (TPR) repeat protein